MTIITESQWLAYYGFQNFPFERPEAGNEGPEFLASCFVRPENFPDILGKADAPATALLFAARGTGKTACRIMVDYFCRTGNVPMGSGQETAYVLSIPHVHLHLIAAKTNIFASTKETEPDRLLDFHVREILRRAMPALSDLLAAAHEIYNNTNNLSPALKQDLSWLALSYSTNLTFSQRIFLNKLLDEPLLLDFPQKIRQEKGHSTFWQEFMLKAKFEASPLDHLAQLADLMQQIDIPATYILVDGVDEYLETAANPEKAFLVIRPLLGTLQLMGNTPYLALKFFLPDSLEPLIKSDPVIRLDRGFIRQTIGWSDNDLVNILRLRLDAVKLEEYKNRDRAITGFDALCVPELRSQIEREIASEASGNPRHIIILAGLMIRAHFNREISDQEDTFQLNRQDWNIAIETYKSDVISRDKALQKTNSELWSLIKQGESDTLEFKSSLRWDVYRKKVNKNLEYVIAKTLAAMLNTQGGILLIGVTDDGQIVGLEHDIRTLSKKNQDGFYLKILQIIETYLGIETIRYISISFESIENKQIADINVCQSHKPVYVKVNNQSELWIRFGILTHQLDIESAINYIKTHWQTIKA